MKMQDKLNNLIRSHEDGLRELKKTSAFVYGWPHEEFGFSNHRSAQSKVMVVQQFFSDVLCIPDSVRRLIDIRSIFVKKGGNGHVIINFVRETDKEKVNPFLKNLKFFNQRRVGRVHTIWRDDLTKQQMELKKEIHQRRQTVVSLADDSAATCNEYDKENEPMLTRKPIKDVTCSLMDSSVGSPVVHAMEIETKAARFIDSHCHLDILFREEDFNESFLQYKYKHIGTWGAGFDGCITNFCHPARFLSTVPLFQSLRQEPDIFFAFGCHPRFACDYNDDVEKIIVDRLLHEKVVAVGEMGLDYSARNHADRDLQKLIFRKQLHLGLKYKKPIVLHCRDAISDCLTIMKEIVPHDYPIHYHCWTENSEALLDWTNYFTKLKICLSSRIYSLESSQIDDLKRMPLDRILLETDSPYFLPSYAYSNVLRSNHPGLAFIVGAKLAEYRNEKIKEVMKIIRKNTEELYGI